MPDVLQPSERRRKVPASYPTNLFASTIEFDNQNITENRNHKRQKRITQLQEYLDDLDEDLSKDDDYQELMTDPWQWWLQVGRSKYLIVFKMAVDFLSIPCTNCECERCFSAAGRTITTDRNSLSPATIEALKLQKNWL